MTVWKKQPFLVPNYDGNMFQFSKMLLQRNPKYLWAHPIISYIAPRGNNNFTLRILGAIIWFVHESHPSGISDHTDSLSVPGT